ncbi:response regulator transcription factor [Paraclostridium bifermentans]|uniref:response regulator transcription factor n=1 Tax=Paraclostridium bifermentans TaxID=1490 RepID=UPI00359C4545
MRVLITSDSFLFAESIGCSLKNIYEIIDVCIEDTNNIYKTYENKYDMLVFYRTKATDYFQEIINLKKIISKIIIIDQLKDENLLSICIDNDIDAYITDIEDEYEFKYVIDKVIKGVKFYDSEVMSRIIKQPRLEIELFLTEREEEVMVEVGKGLSNRDIANMLGVTEFTIKKHLSNIFNKLKLKSRKDIIVYVNEK